MNIFLLAGEVSGDVLGGKLMASLMATKTRAKDCKIS